jgi:3-oxoacyl-[acyl-carrier protein] reductase
MPDMASKNALVTGGTRGIGREISLALARAGANVLACYAQNDDAAERTAKKLKETAGDHYVTRADVSDPDDVARLMDECQARFGTLQVVVHNAGVISHVPYRQLPLAEWRRVLGTNLDAAFLVSQQALPLLSPGSSIVFVGSKAAVAGIPLRAHYTAAKAGLAGLARSLARELGPDGIRVNVLAPGIVAPEPPDEPEGDPAAGPDGLADRLAAYKQRSPLGRLGAAGEVAAAVLFLASDDASFITGETLNVDGGL